VLVRIKLDGLEFCPDGVELRSFNVGDEVLVIDSTAEQLIQQGKAEAVVNSRDTEEEPKATDTGKNTARKRTRRKS